MRAVVLFLFLVCSNLGPDQAWAAPNEGVLFKTAMQAYQKNDFNTCVSNLTALLRLQPKKGLYWFNIGNCFSMSGAYDKAVASYDKVVQLQSPLTPAAKLYKAKALLKMGQTEGARKALAEMQSESLPPGLRADYALELYQQEMYAQAEAQVRQMPRPLDSKTQLLLGMILMKENKNSEAEKVLKSVAAATDLPATDKASARDLVAALKPLEASAKTYGLFLDLAAGTTTNAYLEGRSYAPVSSPLVRAGIGASYRFYQSPSWQQKVSYLFDYENPTNAPELNTQNHSLQVPLVYQNRLFEFGLVPFTQAEIWNGTFAAQKTGALVRTATLGSAWGGGFDLEVYSQRGTNDTYSYLTGSSYSVRPFFSYGAGLWTLQIYWLLGSDGTQDIVYSDGSRLPLQHNYQGPGLRGLWRLTSSSSLLAQMLYLERNYTNNALPGDKHRQDHELSASLKYVYGFSQGWVAYLLAEYNPNKSTLGSDDVRDKNYDNTNLLAGLGWDVF
ncbi:MAG: hypothetical protein JSU04_10840 [Bdellovibrionales bacterium]|nr:hypothetical protein [Bdellovibrionales bacterium]